VLPFSASVTGLLPPKPRAPCARRYLCRWMPITNEWSVCVMMVEWKGDRASRGERRTECDERDDE
jgi:hypothetical protein